MKRSVFLLLVMLVIVMLASCAPGPNRLAKTADGAGRVAGFWLGLWHRIDRSHHLYRLPFQRQGLFV